MTSLEETRAAAAKLVSEAQSTLELVRMLESQGYAPPDGSSVFEYYRAQTSPEIWKAAFHGECPQSSTSVSSPSRSTPGRRRILKLRLRKKKRKRSELADDGRDEDYVHPSSRKRRSLCPSVVATSAVDWACDVGFVSSEDEVFYPKSEMAFAPARDALCFATDTAADGILAAEIMPLWAHLEDIGLDGVAEMNTLRSMQRRSGVHLLAGVCPPLPSASLPPTVSVIRLNYVDTADMVRQIGEECDRIEAIHFAGGVRQDNKDAFREYMDCLRRYVAADYSKWEFDYLFREWAGSEVALAHNLLIRAM